MPDPKLYPQGSRFFAAEDIETSPTETDLIETYDAASYVRKAISVADVLAGVGVVRSVRMRLTIAQVNAGATLVAAPGAGYALRLVDARAISVGGAAGAVTTVDVLGTQAASSVKLAAFAQASLTQSAVLKAGGTGAAVLADGASFATNDANTAITAGKTNSDVTTATHIDFLLEYAVERA